MKSFFFIRLYGLVIFSLSFGFCLHGQTVIRGHVTDSLQVPVSYARIFLSKTTINVLANEHGEFVLSVPQNGNYELIVSALGFKPFSGKISVDGTDQQINVRLARRVFVLDEVVVNGKDRNRQRNFNTFFACFIGTTAHSDYCRITNPRDLTVYRLSSDSILKAFSSKPLVIKNLAFGYVIYYYLTEFSYNFNSGHLYFAGYHFFQEIKGGKAKVRQWEQARRKAYLGSRMHFLRSIYRDSLAENGFILNNFRIDLANQKYILTDTVVAKELYQGYGKGSVMLFWPKPLVITYKGVHHQYEQLLSKLQKYSRVNFNGSLEVYSNGYYPVPNRVTWVGDMASDRMGESLPFDYFPKNSEVEPRPDDPD